MSANVKTRPEKVNTPIMIPMMPTTAPIFKLLIVPSLDASTNRFGPIRVSSLTQEITIQDERPKIAEYAGEYPKSIKIVIITRGRI